MLPYAHKALFSPAARNIEMFRNLYSEDILTHLLQLYFNLFWLSMSYGAWFLLWHYISPLFI